jgi:photosystem II stability/assembly factor-like uncharacterized protein
MLYRNRFRMTIIISLFLCLGVLSSCGSDNGGNTPQPGVFTWNVQQQPEGGDELWGVSALDESHVWTVGHGGTILFYDGTSWTAQASGTTDFLRGVSALDESHVWTVGDGGTILFYDGTSWSPQARGTTDILSGVSALDESHVWAVGHAEIILFGTK